MFLTCVRKPTRLPQHRVRATRRRGVGFLALKDWEKFGARTAQGDSASTLQKADLNTANVGG